MPRRAATASIGRKAAARAVSMCERALLIALPFPDPCGGDGSGPHGCLLRGCDELGRSVEQAVPGVDGRGAVAEEVVGGDLAGVADDDDREAHGLRLGDLQLGEAVRAE